MDQMTTLNKFSLLQEIPDHTSLYLIAMVKDITDVTVTQPDVSYRTSVRITDGSKIMTFMVWKSIEVVRTFMEENSVYRFYGTHQFYQGKPSFKFISCDAVTDERVLRKYDLQQFKGLTQDNYEYFVSSVRKIKDFRLRRLVEVCYGLGRCPAHIEPSTYSRRQDKQLGGSGSINHHDNYPGGIINHIVGMLRQVDLLEGIYGNAETPPIGRKETACTLNWDRVRAMVYLHDLGKQDTYIKTLGGRVIFNKATCLNHEDISMVLVAKYIRDLEPEFMLTFAEEQLLLAGIKNHGSTSYDKSPEEKILSQVDMADSVLVDSLSMDTDLT